MGSRGKDFLMLSFSEVQFRENRMHSLLVQKEILSNACVFNFEFMGITKAKCWNEAIL